MFFILDKIDINMIIFQSKSSLKALSVQTEPRHSRRYSVEDTQMPEVTKKNDQEIDLLVVAIKERGLDSSKWETPEDMPDGLYDMMVGNRQRFVRKA